jgi:hypothetical protein
MKANCQEKVVRFVKVRGSKPLNIVRHERDIMQASPNTITVLKLRSMR